MTKRRTPETLPATGDHGTQLDAYKTAGSSPPGTRSRSICYPVHEADIADQMLQAGCHGSEVREGLWEFTDEFAARMAVFLRAAKYGIGTPLAVRKERAVGEVQTFDITDYVRTHNFHLPPSPIDTTVGKAPQMYSMGHFDSYGYAPGDEPGAPSYGWGTAGHEERKRRDERMARNADDESSWAAEQVQRGYDKAQVTTFRWDGEPIAAMPDRLPDQPKDPLLPDWGAATAAADTHEVSEAGLVQVGHDGAAEVTQAKQTAREMAAAGKVRRKAPQPIADTTTSRNRADGSSSLFLSTTSAGKLCGISATSFRTWAQKHGMPCEVASGRYWYRLEDVLARENMLAGSIAEEVTVTAA